MLGRVAVVVERGDLADDVQLAALPVRRDVGRAGPVAPGGRQVVRHHARAVAVAHEAAVGEKGDALAEGLHGRHVVADEQDGPPAPDHVADLAEALPLEDRVADGEHLVDDEDLGLQVGRHGEGQPHVHAAGIVLARGVEELVDAGEVDDLVELAGDLPPRHAEDRAVQVDVLTAGQLRMEARPDLQQAPDPPAQLGPARGRASHAAEHFEESRFARPVAADDADHVARLNLEGDVFQGPDRVRARAPRQRLPLHPRPTRAEPSPGGFGGVDDRLAERAHARRGGGPDVVLLREVFDFD